ncbi:MAG: sensor histidine kinase [Anaerolineae bacterium]
MRKINSLTLKLTAIVLFISLLSVALVVGFTRYATVWAFDRMLLEQNREAFIAIVTAHYEATETWAGVIQTLRAQSEDPFMFRGLILVGQDNRVVVPDAHTRIGQLMPPALIARGTPVELDNERIGTLLENAPLPPRRPENERYLAWTNQALLLIAGGVSVAAILLGIFASRNLTRSLRELTAATHSMAQGNLEQTVPVRSQDELGQLAVSFNRMSADLARATTLRRQMTADIAHDLRTPLTVIKGYTEALRDGDLPATQATFETMYREAQHLSGLIDDLRTLSLAEAGELTLNRRPTSPFELLFQAQAAYLPQAQEAGVTVHIEADDAIPDIAIDPERIARVLGNLIVNALRYTGDGGHITLHARTHPNGVLLRVSDTGTGIPPEDLPHIFDRFYRGDAARQSENGESGLGLAIAKSLVEAHGGAIAVRSIPGQETTFEIFLPETRG